MATRGITGQFKGIQDEFSHLPTSRDRWRARHPEKNQQNNKYYKQQLKLKDPERLRDQDRLHWARKGGYTPPPLECDCPSRPLKCDLCQQIKPLCLDHNHETGQFRGWLCRRCNSSLGGLGDTVEALERALIYLRGSNAV